jgi:hypothetical protein
MGPHSRIFALGVGYGLSIDGMWRPHGWVLSRIKGKTSIIETTVSRSLYYGVAMFPPRDASLSVRGGLKPAKSAYRAITGHSSPAPRTPGYSRNRNLQKGWLIGTRARLPPIMVLSLYLQGLRLA